MIVAVPSVYLPTITQEAYNVPKLVLLIVGVSLAVALKLLQIGRGTGRSRYRAMTVPALAVLLPLLVSWGFSRYRGWAWLGEHSRQEGLLPYILVITAGFLVADSFRGHVADLCKLFAASGTAVSVLALMQAFGLDVAGRPLVAYVSGPMGNSNFLGAFLAIVLPVAVGTWVFRMWNPVIGMLTTAVIATAILMSFSQGAWLAGPAGVAVVAASTLRQRRRMSIAIAVVIPLLAAAIGVGAVVYSLIEPFGRFSDAGNRTRALWWRSAVAMAVDSPLVGHGPNAYAMEAVRYRLPPDALELPQIVADGPHSVPISLLAGAGIPGMLGFFAAVAWAVRRSARLWRGPPDDVALVFGGALASYVVVALVNDHLMMEFAFWVCLGGLTLGGNEGPIGSLPPQRSGLRSGAAYAGAAIVAVVGVTWSSIVLLADIRAQTGIEAFEARDISAGRTNLRDAIALRDEYVYRQIYANYLGISALQMREEGRDLIEEMDSILSPLEGWPKLSLRLVHARWLHEWSVFDNGIEDKALTIYQRAHAEDPFNPWPVLYISDIHLQAGRAEEALDELNDAIDLVEAYPAYSSRFVDLWANQAMAYLQLGETAAARSALDRVLDLGGESGEKTSCRTALAFELERREQEMSRPPRDIVLFLGFRCTRAQLRLVPDLLPAT